jgi:hypothetical protein
MLSDEVAFLEVVGAGAGVDGAVTTEGELN